MSDLERRLEDLFMSDSRSRRVTDVHIPARRSRLLPGVVFAGATALAVLALVVALNTLRAPDATPLASPSITPLPSSTPGATGSPDATATAAPLRPDGRHGFLSQTGQGRVVLRTEQDATPVAELSAFSGVAVSPDGHRLALFRTSQTGQQLVWGQSTRIGEARLVVDLAGSGEFGTSLAWAADNSNSLAFTVVRPGAQQGVEPPPLYSALRSVDLETGAVRELARTTNEFVLVPLVWRPRDNIAVAFETGPGGFAYSYVVVRGTQLDRTVFDRNETPLGLQADREGARILGLFGRPNEKFLRWWTWDRPDQPRDMRAQPGEGVFRAAWRPGSDEIGVEVLSSAPRQTPARGRVELWSVAADVRRVVAGEGGFELFRTDGTAAIGLRGTAPTFEIVLIDLATGATTPIPRANDVERPLGPAVLF